ncbi:MAG: CBS domain-containing protein [Planctomycetota bacterium]
MKAKSRYQPSKTVDTLFSSAVVKIKADTKKAIAKSRYKPSKTVEALLTSAVVKIKTEADKAVAKQKAMSETEPVSAKAGIEAKVKEPILEQKVESEAEPVSQKETTGTFESEAEQEPAAGEVSKSIQQMAQSQPNLLREQSLTDSGLCAKDIMLKELVWGSPKDSVQQAITKMQQYDSGHLMVGVGGILEGIVSNSNITAALSPYLRPVFARCRRPLDDATLQIRIKWIMSKPAHIVKPETPLANVMENMCRFGLLCLPVVDQQGKVQGLVTEADIFKVLLQSKHLGVR